MKKTGAKFIVVLMNVVFWGMKPQQPESGKEQ